MNRPNESDYTSQVAYTRALEEYCDSLAQRQARSADTWVGLTNNELQPIADEYRILFGSWVEDFARAIEAKLRSKNEDRN